MTTTDTKSFISRCGFCSNKGTLLRCSRCKVILYCNQEHQAAHRPAHKSACNAVANKCGIVDVEEAKLRSNPGDNPFENAVGHFWGIFETRDYMWARFALVEALRNVKTQDSVQAQLNHMMDMLRLCRSDNLGVRDLVPALMLRLDKDQECYDFIKWYSTTGQASDYDWGDMTLPFLDIENADVFESVEYLCIENTELSHMVGVTLLKIKLLLDLTALQNSTVVGEKVPREILDRMRTYIPRSPIITENKSILRREDHATAIDQLTAQVHALYKAVKKSNKRFWPSLLQPGRHLTARPEEYSQGSMEEMQLVLKHSYDSWVETPGAIEAIEAKKAHI